MIQDPQQRELDRTKQRTADYRAVFNTEQGQRVLRDLMNQGGFFRSSFVRGAQDSGLEMALNEGRRNVVLYILGQLDPRWEHAEELMQDATDPYSYDPLDQERTDG